MQNRFRLPLLAVAFVVITAVFSSSAFAQAVFTVDVHDSVVTMREGQLLDLKATITNIHFEPIRVRAIRFRNEVPGVLWYTAMCYGDQCYMPTQDTTPAALVAPGGTLDFKLTVGTDEYTYGIAQVRAGIRFDTGDNTISVSKDFTVNVDGTSAAPIESVTNVRNAWPNPARTSVFVPLQNASRDDAVRIQLIDAMGNVVVDIREASVVDGSVRIDVSSVATGAYIYRINEGSTSLTGRIAVSH